MDNLTELRQRLRFMRAYYARSVGNTKTAAGVRVKELKRMIEEVEIERSGADDSDTATRSEPRADIGEER